MNGFQYDKPEYHSKLTFTRNEGPWYWDLVPLVMIVVCCGLLGVAQWLLGQEVWQGAFWGAISFGMMR